MSETKTQYSTGYIKPVVIFFLIFLIIIISGQVVFSQEDSITGKKTIDPAKLDSAYHSPQKAAFLSAIIPGMGQVYNKKIWKVPIIYGGFISLGYLIRRNSKEYKLWRQAYIDYPNYNLNVSYQLTLEQINLGKDFYKRQKELSIIGTVGFYILQIIDATVDGYLFTWSVGDDLSLKVEPTVSPDNYFPNFENSFAIRACLSF